MKKNEIYLVMCTQTEELSITPRVAKDEETAMQIKKEMVEEVHDYFGISEDEIVNGEYMLEDTDYSYTIHSNDFQFYVSVHIQCLTIE